MSDIVILIVEDERIIAMDIQYHLERMGYEVPTIASCASEAIAVSEKLKPNLVLMDIKLKGEMDGIEAAREIQNRLDIPIMYLTAYVDDDTIERARQTDPIGFIFKPFRENDLRSAVETALQKLQ